MEVTKVAVIEEKSAEAAVDSESVVAEDTEDVGPGQHLFGEPLEMYLLREPKLAVAFSGGCDSGAASGGGEAGRGARCAPIW